jgi:hypothetical protein
MTFTSPQTTDELTTVLHTSEDPPRLEMVGQLTLPNPDETFLPLLEKFHEEYIHYEKKALIADLRAFKFNNSSGMKIFIRWLTMIGQTSESDRYKLTLICNKKHTWQVGLQYMLIMAKGAAEVQYE